MEDWRFEELLEGPEKPLDAIRSLHHDNISHIAINHRFFLVDGNADLQEGRTEKLQVKFQYLIDQEPLIPIHQVKTLLYTNNRNRHIDSENNHFSLDEFSSDVSSSSSRKLLTKTVTLFGQTP